MSCGFGSSAPVVTSNGTTDGSALVWVVWMADGSGQGAELRAYDADILFNTSSELRLEAAARHLGINLSLLTSQAGHA